MTPTYCLDSGVFINSWTKHFPIDVFPSVWNHLDKLCRDNVVFVPPEVAKEVYRIDDGVAKWLRARRKIIARPSDEIVLQTKEIINQYQRLAAEGSGRSGADPWVIGYAFHRKAIVVTEEQYSNNLNKPKIPDVCDDLQMTHMSTVGLLRSTGFRST